ALAECFLPAVFIHLALFFPVRRTSVRRAAAVSYLPAAALALVYEHRLGSPALYPGVHAFATLYLAGAGLFVLAAVVAGYVRARSELVRHRVRFAVLGLLVAFVYPLLILTASVIEGGRVPANVMGFTAFLFPLSIAYAVHKLNLDEILRLTLRFPGDVLGLEHVTMFICTGNGFEEAARSPERAPGGHLPRLVADRSLTRRLADLPRVLVRDSLALQNANEGGA